MKKNKTKKEIISDILFAISLIIILWMVASFIDVISHNMPGQQESEWTWNFFRVILKIGDAIHK